MLYDHMLHYDCKLHAHVWPNIQVTPVDNIMKSWNRKSRIIYFESKKNISDK